MAREHESPCLCHRWPFHPTCKAVAGLNEIGGLTAGLLRNKAEGFLKRCYRMDLFGLHWLCRRRQCCGATSPRRQLHSCCQCRDRLVLEDVTSSQPDTQLLGARDHLNRENGVASEIEEAVVDADVAHLKRLL